MSLPPYPKYKDSGADWLGQIPAHWDVRRLRYLCDIQTGSRDTENAVENGEYPFFVRSQVVERINSFGFDCEAVLTAGDGVGVGRVFHHHVGPFDFHQRVYMMNNFRQVSGRFLFHYLRENFYKVALEGGAKSTVDSLRRPLFANFIVAVPPADEQRAIVGAVEREMAKIDTLIAEQQRLVELLKEKRQAVISHAVTKGLNPDAPMKPSSVEWLGSVPKHWAVMKIKRLAASIEQGWSPQCEGFPAEDGEWGVLKVGCVNGGRFNPLENKLLPPELEPVPDLGIRQGDLLVARANTRELAGSAAVAEQDFPRLMLCDKLYRLRFAPAVIAPAFVSYLLGCPAARGRIECDATGASASMVNIAQSTILELEIPVPPREEQEAIVAELEAQLTAFDTLCKAAQDAIALLQERRKCLIAAAVTGQVDVREFAPQQPV